MRALVRNCFTGDAPYVYGTPEYEAIMGVFGRFGAILKHASVNGSPENLYDMLEKTIGKYGLSDDNARFALV